MQDFQKLAVWKRAHGFVLEIYRISGKLPNSENFGLILNLRRSATGVAMRIAEGAGKPSDAEFAAELKRARATGYELEYLVLLSRDLGFIDEPTHGALAKEIIEIRKMLSGLLKSLSDL